MTVRRKKITEKLNDELSENEPVLNLASNEYFKAVDSKVLNSDVYSANFKQFKNGTFKTIAIFSKRARGLMTRFIIDNDISEINVSKYHDKPMLGYIIVGDLPESSLYVKLKRKAAEDIGI